MDVNGFSREKVTPYRKLDFNTFGLTNSIEVEEKEPSNGSLMKIDGTETVVTLLTSKEMTSTLGIEFESKDSAYNFYQEYAKAIGFGNRKGFGHENQYSGIMLDKIFCCSREGKQPKDKRDYNVRKHRAETRCCCATMMKISCRHGGKYRIVQFVVDHNHELSSPSKTHLFRSHQKVTSVQEVEIDMDLSCGINLKETVEFMAKQVGGREKLGFIHVDCKNYLKQKITRQMRVGDTGGVLEYF
jgi:zinc finger SWIM domain-containing protein 3